MDIVFILLPASVFLALLALIAFLWSAKSGQFSDMDTPAKRLLHDDVELNTQDKQKKIKNS